MVKTVARLTLPFALLENGSFDVSLDKRIAKITVQRENTVSRQGQMTGMEFMVSKGGTLTMKNDFYGLVNITRLRVELPYLIYPSKIQDLGNGRLEDLSHDHHINVQRDCLLYLNRLIEVIRWQTRRYWIHNLSGSDIYLNSFDLFDDQGNNIGGQTHGQPIHTLFNLPNFALYQSDRKKEIDAVLETEERIPVHDMLYLDALQDFSQGRFNKAVMLINTALESATTEFLLQTLMTQEESKENAKKKIDKILKFGKKKNGKSGFHKILTEDFKDIAGRSLEDEQELWDGFNDARLKRKTTLHPYVGQLYEGVAKKAIIDVLKVMNWVLQQGRYTITTD